MKKLGLYAGSFDPPTRGHMDIILEASKLFDELIVGIAENPGKNYLYDLSIRKKMLNKCIEGISNTSIEVIEGLTVQAASTWGVNFLVRGIRNSVDAQKEIDLALANKELSQDLQTIIIPTSMKNASISSSLVREILKHQGDVQAFVPKEIQHLIK